jgi:hypothetical protein
VKKYKVSILQLLVCDVVELCRLAVIITLHLSRIPFRQDSSQDKAQNRSWI